MALEDIAAMRAFGNMVIVQPCDEVETHRVVDFLMDHDGPVFLRLMRQGTQSIHGDDYQFEFFDPDGNPTGFVGIGAAHGTRIKVEPLP